MNIKLINTQRVLSPTAMTLGDYAVNPYRGCEFACIYCYGKLAKNIEKNPGAVCVKINAADILEKELKYRKIKRVVLGTSCECFTYAELRFSITEKIIALLNKNAVPFIILTKSSLIEKYLPLIKRSRDKKIFFTFNFASEDIKRLLEKRSPSLLKRLKTLAAIKEMKIPLRVHIGPFIPYLSDLEKIFGMVKDVSDEINLEIYHSKMGNFNKVIGIIRNWDKSIADKIKAIYKDRDSYYNFSENLRDKLKKLNRAYRYKIYYIVPEFDTFYDSRINYEQPLV
ncbi:MAG: radical SAM protein [Candidatus Omnitrophota bacterium]